MLAGCQYCVHVWEIEATCLRPNFPRRLLASSLDRTSTSTCICVFVNLCICVFVYLCICVFVYLCICAFVFVYFYCKIGSYQMLWRQNTSRGKTRSNPEWFLRRGAKQAILGEAWSWTNIGSSCWGVEGGRRKQDFFKLLFRFSNLIWTIIYNQLC